MGIDIQRLPAHNVGLMLHLKIRRNSGSLTYNRALAGIPSGTLRICSDSYPAVLTDFGPTLLTNTTDATDTTDAKDRLRAFASIPRCAFRPLLSQLNHSVMSCPSF